MPCSPRNAERVQLRALVAPAYAGLAAGNDLRVAVRSSAIGEDSAGASFADQHDTFLDISGTSTAWWTRCSAAGRPKRSPQSPPRGWSKAIAMR